MFWLADTEIGFDEYRDWGPYYADFWQNPVSEVVKPGFCRKSARYSGSHERGTSIQGMDWDIVTIWVSAVTSLENTQIQYILL